jgi:hypothetical protein
VERGKLLSRLVILVLLVTSFGLTATGGLVAQLGGTHLHGDAGEPKVFVAEPTVTPLLDPNGLESGSSPTRLSLPLAEIGPVNCATMSPPVVGFEISKGQNPTDVVDFLTDLAAAGFSVGTIDIVAGPVPPCVNFLIIHGVTNKVHLLEAYTPEEGTMFQAWVADGHGLMLSGDWGSFKEETQALFAAYGYAQIGGAVRDPTDFDPDGPAIDPRVWVNYQIDNFSPHPILDGVASLQLQASSWLDSASNAIVTTDPDAIPATVPVMVAFSEGSGCVVAITDSNWYATDGGTGGYPKHDNALVARQIIDWLQDCSAAPPPGPTATPTATPVTVPAGYNVYLPKIMRPDNTAAPSFPVFIGGAIPVRPVAYKGEIFYTTTVRIPSPLPAGGRFHFSAQPDEVAQIIVDDALFVLRDGDSIFSYDFAPGGTSPQPAIVEAPRAMLEQLAGQAVQVEYRDLYDRFVWASVIWLIWTP